MIRTPVAGFRAGAVRFAHVPVRRFAHVPVRRFGHVPVRRFAVSAPIAVGFPYFYGDSFYDDPVGEECVVQRRLVQTAFGLRWRRVTVCYN